MRFPSMPKRTFHSTKSKEILEDAILGNFMLEAEGDEILSHDEARKYTKSQKKN